MTKSTGIALITISLIAGMALSYTFAWLTYPREADLRTETETENVNVQMRTTPPPGYSLEYNVSAKKYRWCFQSGYCPNHTVYDTPEQASKAAWAQEDYRERSRKPRPYDPLKDEGKWGRVIESKNVENPEWRKP